MLNTHVVEKILFKEGVSYWIRNDGKNDGNQSKNVGNTIHHLINEYEMRPYYIKTTKGWFTTNILDKFSRIYDPKISLGYHDRFYDFDRTVKQCINNKKVAHGLETDKKFKAELVFNITRSNWSDEWYYDMLVHEPIIKFHDFMQEGIKEYITPFTLRYESGSFAGIILHPGSVRKAFLWGLPDETIIKFIICYRDNDMENKILKSFGSQAVPLFQKSPEDISKILEIERKYNKDPKSGIEIKIFTHGKSKGLIELVQPFYHMTRNEKYTVTYTNKRIKVNTKLVTYFDDNLNMWVPNIGKYKYFHV